LLAVKGIAPSSIDIMVIDGKLRAYTAELALPLLKSGGILIIGDVHRYLPNKNVPKYFPKSQYEETWKMVYHENKNWRFIRTSDGIDDTTFYIKP